MWCVVHRVEPMNIIKTADYDYDHWSLDQLWMMPIYYGRVIRVQCDYSLRLELPFEAIIISTLMSDAFASLATWSMSKAYCASILKLPAGIDHSYKRKLTTSVWASKLNATGISVWSCNYETVTSAAFPEISAVHHTIISRKWWPCCSFGLPLLTAAAGGI